MSVLQTKVVWASKTHEPRICLIECSREKCYCGINLPFGTLWNVCEVVSPKAELCSEATVNLIDPWKGVFSALHSDSISLSKSNSCFTYPWYC